MLIEEFSKVLDGVAPLYLSDIQKEKGSYDNSGLIVKCNEKVENVLFSLDLTQEAVKKAKRLKCDTIVTHHPAIYYPIKSLSCCDSTTGPVVNAIKNGLNVFSYHLNLDVVNGGIDDSLKDALLGKDAKILFYVDDKNGYGREFSVGKITLKEYVEKIKKNLNTNKILVYGNRNQEIKRVASFCGGGSSYALDAVKNNLTTADVIISSDFPHHVIKELIESGKTVVIITHYSSENFGFNRFYEKIKNIVKEKVNFSYFSDKRF